MKSKNLLVKTQSNEALVPDCPIAYFLRGIDLHKVRGCLSIAKKEINPPATDALIDAVEGLVESLKGMASPLPQIGETVVLKTGGPPMRVFSVDYFGVHAEWDCEGLLSNSFFPFEAVKKVV